MQVVIRFKGYNFVANSFQKVQEKHQPLLDLKVNQGDHGDQKSWKSSKKGDCEKLDWKSWKTSALFGEQNWKSWNF